MSSKKNKTSGGYVFSTDPDFKFEEEKAEIENSPRPQSKHCGFYWIKSSGQENPLHW